MGIVIGIRYTGGLPDRGRTSRPSEFVDSDDVTLITSHPSSDSARRARSTVEERVCVIRMTSIVLGGSGSARELASFVLGR
jgi:hypothetical protein